MEFLSVVLSAATLIHPGKVSAGCCPTVTVGIEPGSGDGRLESISQVGRIFILLYFV